MIKQLDNTNEEVAKQIYDVFQSAYKIEAELIGTTRFPPLARTVAHITCSRTMFFGYLEASCLAGVIEITVKDLHLEIDSLTVEPNYFRKGIAGKLLSHVMCEFKFNQAAVETAVVNAPAIRLYQKHGFNAFKRWTPEHGIEKIALTTNRPNFKDYG